MSGYVTPDKLQLLRVIQQGRPRRLSDEVSVNHNIPANGKFKHHLNTETFFPVFSTNYNAHVWLKAKTATDFTVGFNVAPGLKNTLTYRLTTTGGTLSVPAAAASTQLVHNLNDDTAAFFFTPSWNTNVWVTAKLANSILIAFSVAPTQAQTIYYGRFDLDTSAVDSAVPVTASAMRHTHNHGLGHVMADVFVTRTWNTTAYLYDPARLENEAQIRFGTLAPPSKTIDIAAGVPLIGELV